MSDPEIPTEVRVPKRTGTYADVLGAIGRAVLLSEFYEENVPVIVSDAGPDYCLSVPAGSARRRPRLDIGYQYLLVKGAQRLSGAQPEPFPYEEERDKEQLWRAWQKKQRHERRRKRGEEIAEAEPPAPDPRLELYKAIHSLQGSKSWNALAVWLHAWLKHTSASSLRVVVERLSGKGVAAPEGDLPSFGVVQAFSPAAGKGTNRPKPDGAPLDNLKGSWQDWFDEWMKYRGVGYCLNARFFDQDIKFAALLPGSCIELEVLRNLVSEFRERGWVEETYAYTNIKHDVQALLWLAKWLVEHSEAAPRKPQLSFRVLGPSASRRPRQLLAGISTAYFKSLGQARALAGASVLLLPDWLPIARETYGQWIEILAEHRRVLRLLSEDISEEARLLARYRDALCANQLVPYLEFFADYGENFMRRRAADDYREQFSVPNLKELIMAISPDGNNAVHRLVNEPAFLNMARAVHEATVSALYWQGRAKQESNLYDVHYGLAQRWKRAVDQHQFINELMDFVRAYCEENAKKNPRRAERKQYVRAEVTTADLDGVLAYLRAGELLGGDYLPAVVGLWLRHVG